MAHHKRHLIIGTKKISITHISSPLITKREVLRNLAQIYDFIPYSEFISLGAKFPEWSVLSFSRNFPDLKIHDPNN